MSNHFRDVLRDNMVDEAEIDALMKRYDLDGSGKLEFDEMQALASDLVPVMGGNIGTVMSILDFYQDDTDGAFDREELRNFLELHVDVDD